MTVQAVLDEYYAALSSGDADRLAEVVAEDIVVTYHNSGRRLPWGGEWRGFAQFRAFLVAVGENLEIISVAPTATHITGETVVVILNGVWRARATDAEIRATVANIFTIRGGKVAAYEVFPDSAAFAEGIGALNTPATYSVSR